MVKGVTQQYSPKFMWATIIVYWNNVWHYISKIWHVLFKRLQSHHERMQLKMFRRIISQNKNKSQKVNTLEVFQSYMNKTDERSCSGPWWSWKFKQRPQRDNKWGNGRYLLPASNICKSMSWNIKRSLLVQAPIPIVCYLIKNYTEKNDIFTLNILFAYVDKDERSAGGQPSLSRIA